MEFQLTVGRVVNGDDDTCSQHDLLPGLANVDDIDAIGPGLPQIRLHVHLEVLAAEVALRSEQHLDVRGRRVEDGGEVVGGHLDGLAARNGKEIEVRVGCWRLTTKVHNGGGGILWWEEARESCGSTALNWLSVFGSEQP